MTSQFGPLITAMVTPFDTHGEVDINEAIRLGEHLVSTGTTTLLLAGTTGESPTLTHDEEFQLFKAFSSHFKGKVSIMAGTGSNCTKTAVESTIKASEAGVDSVLQVVPYYNKPSQAGLEAHFKAVAQSTSLPIMLYNIPGRTGMTMAPETIATLAQEPTIVALKEAAGSVDQLKAIIQQVPKDFLVYSGDDALTVDFMKEGAVGVVSVAAHVVGDAIRQIISLANSGDWAAASSAQAKLADLFNVMFITSNPVPVKVALRSMGFQVGLPRLPLVDATVEEQQTILQTLNQVLSYIN